VDCSFLFVIIAPENETVVCYATLGIPELKTKQREQTLKTAKMFSTGIIFWYYVLSV
jgi:hypothetical protein